MPLTSPFNSITKHDYNVLTAGSTQLKSATHRSDSDSDVSEDCTSLILKPKHLCRKLSLNVKPTVLNRKSNNDGSNNESIKHGFKSITPLLNNATQSSEIMGSVSNKSPRFNASKTSEIEINNNDSTSLISSITTSLGNFDH